MLMYLATPRLPSYKAKKPRKTDEGPSYYYMLRGKYDHEESTFFRGYIDRKQCEGQQDGTWKFVGNSSHDCEKLTKWIIQNQDILNKENKTFHNPDGLFSQKWYSVMTKMDALGFVLTWLTSINSKSQLRHVANCAA